MEDYLISAGSVLALIASLYFMGKGDGFFKKLGLLATIGLGVVLAIILPEETQGFDRYVGTAVMLGFFAPVILAVGAVLDWIF